MIRKAYIIKGSILEMGERKEWIENVTVCKKRAEKIKKDLNNSLAADIENGKKIFDIYIKDDQENVSWNDKEFHLDKMTEDEFYSFSYYRYGNRLPFKIQEMDLD